jgi:PKHD-type hydroxylase
LLVIEVWLTGVAANALWEGIMGSRRGDQSGAPASSQIDVAFNSSSDRARLLSADECDAIIDWAEANPAAWEKIIQPNVSYSQLAVDQPEDDKRINWLLQKFKVTVNSLNSRLWRFDISNIGPVVILRYDAGDQFGLHIDLGRGYLDRKISMIVQLSRPDAYVGGVLEFGLAPPGTAARERGSLLAFPAWVPHRLTPVTSGRRYVVTCFVLGPPFR